MAYLELCLGLGIASGPILAFLFKFLLKYNIVCFIILALVYLIYPIFALRYLPNDEFKN